MAFQALIFHQTGISAKEPKELCVYLNAEFVLLTALYTHIPAQLLFSKGESPYAVFSSVLFTLCSNAPFVERPWCTFVYVRLRLPIFLCMYVCMCAWGWVMGFDSIPCLMHVCLHIRLPHVACFPRLVVAPGSHGTVIYNKGFPAHTLGRVMLPHKLSSEQCALSTAH